MLPARFVAVEALPTTPNGKIDRAALLAAASAVPDGEPDGPMDDEVGRWLRGELAELLDLSPEVAGGDFFALGGTSIAAMQLVSRIRRRFDVDIPVSAVFGEPTVGGIARRIAGCRQPAATDDPVAIDRSSGRLPMSFAQRRLYFLHHLDPTGTAYHVAEAIRLRGRLDVERLQRAVRTVVRRNEVLRTICVHDGAEPQLRPADEPTILRDTAITHQNAGTIDDARGLLVRQLERPFDLDTGLPIRVALVRLSGDDHVLLVVTHHIASDERSMALLLRQLLAGAAAPALQYADYAAWQRDRLTGQVLAERLGYWRERLAGMPPELELPSDLELPWDLELPRDVPAGAGSRRAVEHRFTLGTPVRRQVIAVAKEAGVTPFVVLLTAFGHVLHRHCGTADVAVATPASGRDHPALDDLLGCFINTLVLRLDLSGSSSRRALLRRVGDTVLGAVSHQGVPYD
ncbi:MAG: condensation domain-containing protein, partial [Pseudonocardiaceae bacterium]